VASTCTAQPGEVWSSRAVDQHHCPFCHLDKSSIILENDVAVAFPDAFPVAEHHLLVVPKRHVASLFDLTETVVIGIELL
jgi:hypothetical protein